MCRMPRRLQARTECDRSVAASVIGHDAIDLDAEAFEVGHGGLEEGDGTLLLLVGEDVDAGDAGMVVDGDVSELPTNAAMIALAAPISGDAVASFLETTEFLDVDVDDLTGSLALVARPRLFGLERREQAQFAQRRDGRGARGCARRLLSKGRSRGRCAPACGARGAVALRRRR